LDHNREGKKVGALFRMPTSWKAPSRRIVMAVGGLFYSQICFEQQQLWELISFSSAQLKASASSAYL